MPLSERGGIWPGSTFMTAANGAVPWRMLMPDQRQPPPENLDANPVEPEKDHAPGHLLPRRDQLLVQ